MMRVARLTAGGVAVQGIPAAEWIRFVLPRRLRGEAASRRCPYAEGERGTGPHLLLNFRAARVRGARNAPSADLALAENTAAGEYTPDGVIWVRVEHIPNPDARAVRLRGGRGRRTAAPRADPRFERRNGGHDRAMRCYPV
jgi:hypothetical protein